MLSKHLGNNYLQLKKISTQLKIAAAPKNKWKSVIGLEVHAQLKSASKLFSGSSTTFGEPLNNAVSYFDASIPGTLPVLNRKCVESGIKTALAMGCRVNEVSMFDRKHYFYADLPNGYQITQQHAPLANDGAITFPVIVPGKKIYYKTARLLQLQLEQDSGKSLHDGNLKRSLIDLNRAGLPLMEFVFAPDLETGEEAASLVKELILILRQLNTCTCKMEEGALRVDANISVHQEGDPLGVRTEVKNIGSLRCISQAVTYEIQRQLTVIADGDTITNETRSWDNDSRCTIAMRDKEVVQDYRFMPEPNLPPLRLNLKPKAMSTDDLISVYEIAQSLPELPEDIRQRLINQYKLLPEIAIILVNEPILMSHFLNISQSLSGIPTKLVTNFLINDLLMFCNKININIEDCLVNANDLKDILKSLHAEEINLQSARLLIELLHNNPRSDINTIIKENNLAQISDPTAIENYCKEAIRIQHKAVLQYKKGKTRALYSIVGEAAKLSEHRANMKLVVQCLERMLKDPK